MFLIVNPCQEVDQVDKCPAGPSAQEYVLRRSLSFILSDWSFGKLIRLLVLALQSCLHLAAKKSSFKHTNLSHFLWSKALTTPFHLQDTISPADGPTASALVHTPISLT